MLGIEILNPDTGEPDGPAAWRCVTQGLKRGLILLVSGPDANILQLTPPYTLTDAQADFAVETLRSLLAS
jgi:4-aminobutyrate aminotransferase